MSRKLPTKNSEGRGRPKTELTSELQKLVEDIIYRFRQEVQPRGTISVNSMVKFSKELYTTQQVEVLLKEHFWKNGHGRKILDKKNKVIKTVPTDNELSDKNKVVDTEDAIEKLYMGKPSDKKKLISSLKRNEDNLIRMHKENQKLKERLEKIESALQKTKDDKNKLAKDLRELESLFFTWLDASVNKDTPLINILTTGKARTAVVGEFFQKAFSNPTEGYKMFEEFRSANSEPTDEKVVQLQEKKKKSVYDDFKF